jgi:hypothetical protein
MDSRRPAFLAELNMTWTLLDQQAAGWRLAGRAPKTSGMALS